MLKAIIIEDVHDNIETLKYLLNSSQFDITIIAIADNLKDAEIALQMSDIDIAFLDIQLKDGIIFELLNKLKIDTNLNFELVFTTAFSNFEMAIKAIEFACLDYLTKPLQPERLNEVLNKVAKRKKPETSNKQLNILLEAFKKNYDFPKSITVTLPKGIIEIISIENIQYLKADKNTCIFNLTTDNKLHSIKTFAYYLDLFNNHPDFLQINRSHLLNKNQIKRYNHRTKEITLLSSETLIVSHRMSSIVKNTLSNQNSFIDKVGDLLGLFSK